MMQYLLNELCSLVYTAQGLCVDSCEELTENKSTGCHDNSIANAAFHLRRTKA